MPQTLTDSQRWEKFMIANNEYFLAFRNHNNFQDSAREGAKKNLFNSIAQLTASQKQKIEGNIRYLAFNCAHSNINEFVHLIKRASLSSELMECIALNVNSLAYCKTEGEADCELAKNNPHLWLYRDSKTNERRWYRSRNIPQN